MKVRVYVEGGGTTRAEQASLRKGFQTLFEKILRGSPMPAVICAGGRHEAYEQLRLALAANPRDMCLLLVDSEGPVEPGSSPWEHVRHGGVDRWERPERAGDDQLHFMVEAMEAWLVADREALADYFGDGFNAKTLPHQADVERIPKADLVSKLEHSTKATKTKGKYIKAHGFDLIGRIDPAKVRAASPKGHAARFFDTLVTKCTGDSPTSKPGAPRAASRPGRGSSRSTPRR